MSGRATAEFRVGLVMEQVLGHVTHYHTLRRILAREPGIASRWVEVTYEGNGWLERLTCLPPSVRGVVHGFLQVRGGLRGAPLDALFFHTHKPAVFQWDLLARVPTVLSLDVTPAQYDALGEFYDHARRTATRPWRASSAGSTGARSHSRGGSWSGATGSRIRSWPTTACLWRRYV